MPGQVPGIEHAAIVAGCWDEGTSFVVWTDLFQAGFSGGNGSEGQTRTLTYDINFANGDKKVDVDARISTASIKTGTVTINGKGLDIAAGTVILVSTAGPEIRMKQLVRDTLHMAPREETFKELAKTDSEIIAFFSQPQASAEVGQAVKAGDDPD